VASLSKHKVRQAIVLTSHPLQETMQLAVFHTHLLFLPLLYHLVSLSSRSFSAYTLSNRLHLSWCHKRSSPSFRGFVPFPSALKHIHWTQWSPQTVILTYTKSQPFTMSLHTNFSAIQIKLLVALKPSALV
jgi:hypothetical protein